MKLTEKKKILTIFITAGFVVFLDQLLKYLVIKNISISEHIPFIDNFLFLSNSHNTGAAFSLMQGAYTLIIWFSIIVIGIILYYYNKIPNKFYVQLSTALLLGGIIGNLIDRIRFGYVVDFIDFKVWPSFNIADSAITAGVIGLLIYFIKKK